MRTEHVRGERHRRAVRFERPLTLPGWSPSSWGYDPALESFWAALRPDLPAALGPATAGTVGTANAVLISPEHLITTLPGLARAVARSARVPDATAYLALTA